MNSVPQSEVDSRTPVVRVSPSAPGDAVMLVSMRATRLNAA
jgi:hypothetical protein